MPDTNLHRALEAIRDLGLDERAPDAIDARCRAALQREIEREHSRRRTPARRHLRARTAVPFGLVLALALGAAGYAALSSPSKASDGIDCHLDGELDGSGTIVGLDGRSAIETCADLWTKGAVSDRAETAPAPLHACVEPDGSGAIHVFASGDRGICAAVGLHDDPTAGADPAARSFAAFSRRLLERLPDCPTAAAARQLAGESLHSAGLTDWTIREAGAYDGKSSCASVALDSDARTITITPVPR